MGSFLEKINNKLDAKGGFLRSVALLAGGTAAAHIITLGTLPIITRLYTPDDFSKLAVYSSLLGILSVIACLKYEVAIPLPKSEKTAEKLLIICISSSFLFSTILWALLFCFTPLIKELLGNGYFPQIVWILPLGVLATSLYSAFKFWCTRTKNFKIIAKTKVKQSTAAAITQIGFGTLGFMSIGLLIGQLLYNSAGVISLIRNKKYLNTYSISDIKKTFKNYIRFPKYSVGEALFNTSGVQVPILIIAAVAAPEEAGYLTLASKIMVIPMVLIGASISQVYYSHASEAQHEGRLSSFTYECMQKLALIGIPPILFIGILSPTIFPLVFGSEWERAGTLVTWMTPWFLVHFIVNPVSLSLHVTNNQKLAIMLQFFGLILKLIAVWGSYKISESLISESYAVSSFIFYIVYLICIIKYIRIKNFYKIIFNKKLAILISVTVIISYFTSYLLISILDL